ncbi:MAG: HlyD family efflux transporter periplasmic adaptor subunit [Planctomycetales bacterium]|nr:HlyD family efflux transporter periplasmic adaptor subunit [Planctomycetales bacterium]
MLHVRALCAVPLKFLVPALAGCLCASSASAATPSEQFVRAPGCRVKFAQSALLSTDRVGVLAEVVPPGTYVSRGAVVAQLRDEAQQAGRAVAARQAANDVEVRFAQKSAELAELKFERAEAANRTQEGTVSELELREMKLSAQKARLQLEQAQLQLEVARLQLAERDAELATLRIQAPFAAVVRAVNKQPGEVVQQGDVIAEVVDTRRVRVSGFADLGIAHLLRKDAPVLLEVPLGQGAQRLPGVVTFVDVKIEPVSQRIAFTAEVDNLRGLLREGMQGDLLIPTDAASLAGFGERPKNR